MVERLLVAGKDVGNLLEVSITGEIDISTVNIFKEQLYNMLEACPRGLKFDCTNLQYIDSTGLGAMVGILKRVKDNGYDVIVSHLSSNVKKLFLITGLDKVFVIEE